MISQSTIFLKTDKHEYIALSKDQLGNFSRLIIVETADAKRYVGFAMMKRDIEAVLEGINQLQDPNLSIILQQSSLFFAVVTYAKSFTSNQSGRPSLDAKDVFRNAEQNIKDEHSGIMLLRNDYVAHAGSGFDKGTVVATVLDFGFTLGFDVGCQLSQPVNVTPKLEDFRKLCEYVIKVIEIKIQKSLAKVLKYLSELTEDEFDQSVITPDLNNLYQLTEMTEEKDMLQFTKVKSK